MWRLQTRSLVFASMVLAAVASVDARAETRPEPLPDPLTVSAAMAHATRAHPEFERGRAEVAATAQQSVVAGAGAPPMIMAGIDKLPLSMHGVDFMLLGQYGFPLSDVRALRAEAARRQGLVGRAALDRLAVDLPEAAGLAFVDAWQAERRVEALDAAAEVARTALVVAQARVAAGQSGPADVLRAETELSTLAANRSAALFAVRARRAALAAALGRTALPESLRIASEPPVFSEPPGAVEPDDGTSATGTPASLAGSVAEIAVAEAEVDVARARYGAELSLQGGAMISTMEAPALVAMVGVTLPFAGEVRDAAAAEAQARLVATRAAARSAALAWRQAVVEAKTDLDAARALRTALADEVRPRARQAVELLVAAYGAGREGQGALLDAARALSELDARLVDAHADVARRHLRWVRVRAPAAAEAGFAPEVSP
ncbi:TolC family protein [Myxococcota bacterium]|nr:TolC family protein [Myxococcota bacterium]